MRCAVTWTRASSAPRSRARRWNSRRRLPKATRSADTSSSFARWDSTATPQNPRPDSVVSNGNMTRPGSPKPMTTWVSWMFVAMALLALPVVDAGRPSTHGNEASPELVDPEGDVVYDAVHTGPRDHDFL